MTKLNKLIKQRQEEAEERILSTMDDGTIQYCPRDLESVITQTATEAYRQALEDVLAGLPEEDTVAYGYESGRAKKKAHNTALQTVRAQIEELLDNKKNI
jgi:hypothetical protein